MRNVKYGIIMVKQVGLELRNPFLIYGYASLRYFCDQTEETEKMEVRELAEKLGGDMEAAIRQIAERRKEEKQ